jgi:RNA polymerase sigma-70 factor (ECF subfamily)
MPDEPSVAEAFSALRPLLFSIAYRMLGSVSEAEDVVQESFLRFHRAALDGTVIENPKAYLTTTATRLSLDALRAAKRRRESYVGMWLPEPLLTDPAPGVAEQVETADTLSLAFLVLLESLSPVERAVFLLRDVFDYGYDEIGQAVGRSPANCRQIALRARRSVESRRPRFDASAAQRAELAAQFFAACQTGDIAALQHLLAADVTFAGDGGGRAPAVARVVTGSDKVIALVLGIMQEGLAMGGFAELAQVNGEPGAVYHVADGKIASVVALEVSGGRVRAIRSVVNPDKLQHLGAVADVRRLLREFRQRQPPTA